MNKTDNTKTTCKFPNRKLLFSAITLCLPLAAPAADFPVTEIDDDGTGNTSGTFSHAVLQANTTPGADTITLTNSVVLTGVMKRLIDSDITIQNNGTRQTISGFFSHRPIFIKSGTVTIQGIDFQNGRAKGGGSDEGAPGAGLGGSIFIYDGDVTIHDVTVTGSTAEGGDNLSNTYVRGGGGMLGNSGYYGGGGLFAAGNGNTGGYGGYGNYNQYLLDFGRGGDFTGYIPGEDGGFGGGGAFPSGHGGFGGGGASSNGSESAGNGGFGAAAPYAGSYGIYSGFPGYGATQSGAAGMGGAVFIRSGTVDITASSFVSNQAIGSADAKGLGGAVFVLHDTENSNNSTPASQQGMPGQLATVTGCGNFFNANSASGDAGVNDNDDNIFDLGGVAEDLTQLCPTQQNLMVTEANDDGTGNTPHSLSWAIKESNLVPGDDTITLATDVTITGVMKRLINSNVTIQSDDTRRTVSGNGNYRPLFIKSGQVVLQGFDVVDGNATGGTGFSGGAGMGGGLFIYDGTVGIHDLSFNGSVAEGGNQNLSFYGGGGMFGNGPHGGGGLFASANGSLGGHAGYYGTFGSGGDVGSDGNFGGGGGHGTISSSPGSGGFGGGGALGPFSYGIGGFGGGSAWRPGYGATMNGAGMGGAVFIRAGDVTITNSEFDGNSATALADARGLGGAVFIVHTSSNGMGSPQGMPGTLANVSGCGNHFSNNMATDDINSDNNNDDLFDLGRRNNGIPLAFPCQGPLNLNVTVENEDGTGNTPNSLSWAIKVSNLVPGADTISLKTDVLLSTPDAGGVNRYGLTGTPVINGPVKLIGNGHTLERDGSLSCDLNNAIEAGEFRLLHVGPPGDLDMSDVVLKNGCVDGSQFRGGALLVEGQLNIYSVTFTNNRANIFGGAIGTLSTGFIEKIENSTFSMNTANIGGGISLETDAAVVVNNTFWANHATVTGGAIESVNNQIDLMANNLFSNNTGAAADCVLGGGSSVVSSNDNLSNQNSDDCGIIDDTSLDPSSVAPLADNGCAEPNGAGQCVLTHALSFDSQAVNASGAHASAVDQRGLLADGPRDIGAFEFGATVSDVIFKSDFD